MRPAVIALTVWIGLSASPSRLMAQAPPAVPASAADYRFGAPTGMLVFHVHRDRTGDFEQVMNRVATGLRATSSQLRQDQAAGWRFFRARDASDTVIYVVIVDPVVREADYDPVKMLTEFVPAEAAALYERLRLAVVRVERLDLDPVMN
jgi:hypothetical protein